MHDMVMANPLGLAPDSQLSIHADLLSAQGEILLTMSNSTEDLPRLERRARIYEILYFAFFPLGLKLTHTDKNTFFSRIESFFLETERGSTAGGEKFYRSYLIYRLQFELMSFVLLRATNIADQVAHVTVELQSLLKKIECAIEHLQVHEYAVS